MNRAFPTFLRFPQANTAKHRNSVGTFGQANGMLSGRQIEGGKMIQKNELDNGRLDKGKPPAQVT